MTDKNANAGEPQTPKAPPPLPAREEGQEKPATKVVSKGNLKTKAIRTGGYLLTPVSGLVSGVAVDAMFDSKSIGSHVGQFGTGFTVGSVATVMGTNRVARRFEDKVVVDATTGEPVGETPLKREERGLLEKGAMLAGKVGAHATEATKGLAQAAGKGWDEVKKKFDEQDKDKGTPPKI